MKKKLIRLTESDLHNIIKESVRTALNELDWKTLANAEEKARNMDTAYYKSQGLTPNQAVSRAADSRFRAKRFGDTAKNAFNRDFGYKNGKIWDDDYQEVKMGGDFDSKEEFSPHVVGYRSKGYGNPKRYEHGWDADAHKHVEPEEFFNGNPAAYNAFKNASDEVSNWKRGNFTYKPGEGWKKGDKRTNK
jgi:hypothetical protein